MIRRNTMNRHDKTINGVDRRDAETCGSARSEIRMCKEEWVQYYADRMLKLWQGWQTRLGVARGYVEQLKTDLAALYEEPLKRMFIETTY
jgi:hypothetical protein